MTKDQLQKEIKDKVKPGIKPSDLRKLKRSKSADDIPTSSAQSIPLKKSQSQLEIPLNQPSSKEQIIQLQEQVKFHTQTAANYLQSLQTSQAKVSELETQLKNNPPTQLLSDQLNEKQKELESLRQELETTNAELKNLKTEQSTLLDTNLTLKHQALKDWFSQYQKTKELETELAENIDEASNELLQQDQTISQLRTENNKLQLTNQSLQKDLNLATKLAELRKNPLPNSETGKNLPQNLFYCLFIALFIYSLIGSQPRPNDH